MILGFNRSPKRVANPYIQFCKIGLVYNPVSGLSSQSAPLHQPHALAGKGDDPRRGLLLRQQVAHVIHVGFHVTEIGLQTLAERILAAAVRTRLEAVFRTFAPAREVVFAAQAFGRQGVALRQAEVAAFFRAVDLRQGRLADIAQQVFRVDEVVARIDVAVVLDNQRVAARLTHRADAWLHAAPLGQRGVEHLHEGAAHVADDPFVEDVAQETAVAPGRDGPFGQASPFAVGRDDQRTVEALDIDHVLHSRQELHVFAVHLVAEEAVDLPTAPLAEAVHDTQRVVLHAAVLEHRNRLHHPLEGRLAALRHAERVVNVLRAV